MKILFLQKRPLFPPDTGGKIRTLNVVRYLARWHDLTYLCNVLPEEEGELERMTRLGLRLETIPWREARRGSAAFYGELALNLFSGYPYNVAKDFDRRLRRRAAELLRSEPFDLLICDFVQMARNVMGLGQCAKLLFQHNVEAEIFERHARQDRGWIRRQFMAYQWRKMQRFESQAGREFDAVVAVSDRDQRIFEERYGWRHVQTIDTAVDTDYFQPRPDREQPDRIVFVGSLDWLPNSGGLEWFVEKVWPQIRAGRPSASLQIVGRNPGAGILRLAEVDGVDVAGSVPDVRPYLAEAAVVIVPLLVGGGTRLKIYEAMAMGKAIVSTTLGAEGLSVTPGTHLQLADSPDDFAGQVVALLGDAETRARLGRSANERVRERFAAEQVARQFVAVCRQAVANRESGRVGVQAASASLDQPGRKARKRLTT